MNRAVRNISRRKIRALLVIIALGFSLAILISVPAGIAANQAATQNVTQNMGNAIAQTEANLNTTITQTEASINQTLTEVDCSLTPTAPTGFGFTGSGTGDFNPGQFGGGNFTGQFGGGFGGGFTPGEFGAGAFGAGGNTPMNETYYSDITNITNVSAVAPVLQVSEGHNETVTSRFGDRTFTRMIADYIIEGIPLTSNLVNNYPVLPSNITSGRNLQAGDSGVVLLSENNSAYFGVEVGGTVTILGETFQVIGIHGTSGVSDRQTLYMNLSDAQALTNNTGMVTSLQVYADNAADTTTVASAISALHPELDVVTSQQRLTQLQTLQTNYQTEMNNTQTTYETQVQAAQTTMNQTNSQAFEEIIVAVAATSLITFFVMLYTVRERTKEIGTLKAIGFSNATVMSQFMIEGIMLSLLAGVVAIGISLVAAPFLTSVLLPSVSSSINLFGTRVNVFTGAGAGATPAVATSTAAAVSLSPEIMLIGFAAAVAIGAIGSLYPAWRAAKTRPAEAMRYE
ncbi:MAG TPA: FtsX-like permease family protein [Candidatus Nanoarchaeia archaeon]|nr:FtsX-like permease family protein [Candidatus Nanoarchaeia archaeon]